MISRLSTVPTPIKVIAGFVGASTLLGFTYLIFDNTTALVIVAMGIVLVSGLLFVYRALLEWSRKRRANPLSQSLSGNAAAAPQGISEPARRARLDDLRRNFEQGVEKFRAAGKNLYSVPWYVLVGEPGSGKTEAIRHCNVGFPPGLQDQLQGAGGTLNMNWWFTNQAIILDTAGRLMFEEVPPGSTNEWQEFLKLLKQNRPNSPLNGLLLVIPVDTLIKDSADSIEKKAGKIAQQFDQIQRTLGVRFPVFVIITKCDLLNGFREFFDDLNDPQLQHQIMGWSNPAPLDEKFDPAAVTTHLETVKQRLVDRRSHLLLDPVNTEDPQARRVDQVDALYALPDALTKIAPRLRRYLEMIFVSGEWSPKPLFLRGIYFTSSMTEGSALDAELAEVLGVPVDSLPEGRVWRRDRAYFLRDLFIEKVFREKGLVTRASNADKQQRTRRAIVLTCAIVAVLLLLGLTWLGSYQFEASIGKDRNFWLSANKNIDPREMRIIDPAANNQYLGGAIVPVEGQNEKVTPARFFGNYLDLAKTDIKIPVLFKPMAWITGSVNSQRRETYRALYESTMLAPVYTAARKRVGTLTDSWTPDATAALQQLLKLEYAAATNSLPNDPHPQAELDTLFKLVLSPDDFAKYQQGDGADLQKVLDWVYTDAAGGSKAWPPKALAPGTAESRAAINQGIDATLAYWRRQTGDKSESLESITRMRRALADYQKGEAVLLALRNRPIDKIEEYNAYREVWANSLKTLRAAHDEAVKAWATATKGKTDVESVRKLYEAEIARLSGDAQKTYEALLKYTPDGPASSDANVKPNESYQTLLAARTTLQGAITELKTWASGDAAKATLAELSAFDTAYLTMVKGTDNNMHHRFEVQMQLYDLADKKLVTGAQQPSASLENDFAAVDKDYGDTLRLFSQMSMVGGGPEDRFSQTLALSQFTVDVSARAKKFLLADATLKSMATDPEKWPDAIAERAKALPKDALVRPALPLVSFPEATFSPRFSPDAAGVFADSLETIRKTTQAEAKILDAQTLATSAANIKKSFDQYKDAYVTYWKDQTREDVRFTFKNFAEFSDGLVNVTDAGITAALGEYTKKVTAALARIGAGEAEAAVRNAPGLVREECRNALGNWTNLGNDPRVARRTILALDTTSFREGYIVASSRTSDSIAARYWQALPLEALRVLAVDGQQEINNGLTELARFERFPLAAPGDRKDDLTLPDVLAARTALEKVRGAGAGVTVTPVNAANPAAAGNPQARTIGQGGVTRDSQVDQILDRLRGTNLLRDKQEYFGKLERFFTALPSENKPMTVTLSIAKDKLKEDNSIAYRYSYMAMAQNNKDLKEGALISTVADTVTLEYPGGDLALKFREEPGGPIRLTETFPGNWAVLRLLKSDKAKTVTRDGNKWTVEYLVTDNNKKTYSLWLVLEFKASLPDLKDWPVPPTKQ